MQMKPILESPFWSTAFLNIRNRVVVFKPAGSVSTLYINHAKCPPGSLCGLTIHAIAEQIDNYELNDIITTGATVMTGNTSLERKPLDLGQKSDASAAYVSEAVDIDVRVTASPDG